MKNNERSLTEAVSGFQRIGDEVMTEIVRKSLHFLIACVPALASLNLSLTMVILASGTLLYAYAETLRLQGRQVAFISTITMRAARIRDHGQFVLGPITLGLGAMLALLLYPEPASFIAIYALAFGDGFASLVGKIFGRILIPFTGGKTVEGSLACFLVVFIASYRLFGNPTGSLAIAATATLLEALPIKDYDNIILPVGVGFMAMRLFA
jgi:phytol kinase